MEYIIDGYNLAFSPAFSLKKDLKDKPVTESLSQVRDSIISYTQKYAKGALIVFDTTLSPQSALHAPQWHRHGSVSVIFSPQNLSADDWIIEFLQGKKSPSHFTVITDDNRLQRDAKDSGARVLSNAQWMQNHSSSKKNLRSICLKPTLSHANEHYITLFESKLLDS